MKNRIFISIKVLLCLVFFVQTANAQQTQNRSIAEFLDENGRFQNPEGYSGSLDVNGFQFNDSLEGTPVFTPMSGTNPDNEYWTLESAEPGMNSSVYAIAVSGNDLYVGGIFTSAGGVPANRIARYNLSTGTWHSMGEGTDLAVNVLKVVGSDLYVGGSFLRAGGIVVNRIARYDMNTGSWHALGVGANRSVFALTVVDNFLYVGGDFNTIGGVSARSIARYDLNTGLWHNIGEIYGSVDDFAVYGNNLFVVGSFLNAGGIAVQRIVRYDITNGTWHSIGDGLNNRVYAAAISGNDLFVGGSFTSAGGVEVSRVARYDISTGNWFPLGGQVNGWVLDLAIEGDNLYVGGLFTSAADIEVNHIARYDLNTGSWHALGGGLNSQVRSIAVSDNDLFIGGNFTIAEGGIASRIVRYDTEFNSWHSLTDGSGTNNSIRALLLSGDDLIIGGDFTSAGGIVANYIARYNMITGSWHTLGEGLNHVVRALAIYGNDLYVGGLFTNAGGIEANHIARYNMETGSWHSLGEGTQSSVHAFATHGNDLFVGGFFTSAGNTEANYIARYNMLTGNWYAIDNGPSFVIYALAISGEDLFVGGAFTSTGGIEVNRIARYNMDTGSWHALDEGLNDTVYSLALVGDDLYVGGRFSSAGSTTANNIARYNIGTGSWFSIGDGLNSSVNALTLFGESLFVGGLFSEAGDVDVNRIARYDINVGSWHALGDGVNNDIHALAVGPDGLYVGGNFTLAGNKPASRLARWSGPEFDPIPEINFSAAITVSDGNGNAISLTIGTATNATTGFDPQYDQMAPPPPPIGAFDARLLFGGISYFRFFQPTTTDQTIWNVRFAPANGAAPITLSWNPADLPVGGSMRLTDLEGGIIYDVDMRKQSSLTVEIGSVSEMIITYTLFDEFERTYLAGWNLVGLPVNQPHDHFQEVFTGSLNGTLFRFDGYYQSAETLEPGNGYWLYFGTESSEVLVGLNIPSITVSLSAGWNLISGPTEVTSVADIDDPDGIIVGSVFGFNEAYEIVSELAPGLGYWINSIQAGNIGLTGGFFGQSLASETDFGSFHKLYIQNQDRRPVPFYLGGDASELPANLFVEFPPLPPTGAFDVRFQNHTWLTELRETSMLVQSPGENLTLSFHASELEQEMGAILVVHRSGGITEDYQVSSGESITIAGAGIVKIDVSVNTMVNIPGAAHELPQVVELAQNYPNPFNPTTNITFGLPETGNVRLEVYNVMGQRVATLVNDQKPAGYHTVTFDASRLASGTYLYRLHSGNTVITKKLMLIK
mgnify:CR=1 FL=1